MKISKEWANNEITYFGETRQQQLTSLRKKLFDHKESSSHKAALKLVAEANKEVLENVCIKSIGREKEITAKIFRTAYKVVKKNQCFNNFEAEIDVQELNGLDMGHILHSTNACINIVHHISSGMRKNLFQKIVNSKCKISLIIDEGTTLSQKSTLIVYVRVFITDCGMPEPVNLFLDLIELPDVTAKGIFSSLLHNLNSIGMTEEYLQDYLVSVACDGANVMLGARGGVKKLLKDKFPSVLVWHCANHRLELSVHDAVKAVSGINRFKSFIDKLYVLYHASPKNGRELQLCANTLDIQLLKIGRILSTRWVASSFRSVSAVWQDYEALVLHFEEAKKDCTRDSKDRSMYDGLQRKITSVEFVLDLGLMCDALQELSELSLDLQERNMDLYRANNKIKSLIQIFEERKQNPGPYYKTSITAASRLIFKGTALHRKDRKDDPPICPDAFYENLKIFIAKRLLDDEEADLPKWAKVLDPKQWPEDIQKHLTFGETEIRNLSKRFHLNERAMIHGFREYLSEKTIPDKLLPLKLTLDTIPISSSECERGFSQMNLIVTPSRSSLLVTTISALMFIKIVGPPLTQFDPTKYVQSWMLRGHRSAIDTRSKQRNRDTEPIPGMTQIWSCM
ncbi:E3 SUMO-protein ligase KIAA1586-like [Microcaecilia unicolor]|uniref:E3 SUMO-protein ligase KIAA1586-like n=1 Tax=Microcaecilia unicolor TaxID=1415580 RepID=A0A6P7X867_9AMPH|nr:E3 SUMO-protein ligase KIAA1586-like [Microcaecilia unicolor]